MNDPTHPTVDGPEPGPDVAETPALPDGHLAFEWGGRTWSVPGDASSWPYETGLAMETGLSLKALSLLLPADQHAAFAAMRPTVGDAHDMVGAMHAAMRAKPGESPAS